VHFLRSCDWGETQQRVLVQVHRESGTCVFRDLADRLADEAKRWVDLQTPGSQDTKTDAAQKYAVMREYLREDNVIPDDATSGCCVHGAACPVYPGVVLARFLRDKVKNDLGDGGSSSANPPSVPSDGPRPWYEEENLELLVKDPSHLPLIMNVGGLTCTDYTGMGKQLRDAGPSEKYHAIYMADRRKAASRGNEHVYFTECSDKYPALRKQREELPSHKVIAVRSDPAEQGDPVNRPRSLAAGICEEHLVWCGPEPDDVQKDFDSKFKRQTVLTGHVYMQADDYEIEQYVRCRANTRKQVLPETIPLQDIESILHLLVSPGQMTIKSEYEELPNFTENFIADISHHPGMGPKAGVLCPSLCTHPLLYSWKHKRLVLPSEMWAAQGLDYYAQHCGSRGRSPLMPFLISLPEHKQKIMIGNTMHIPSMTRFMVYVLSNCVWRDSLQKMPRQLDYDMTTATGNEDESDDGSAAIREDRVPPGPEASRTV